MRILFEKTPQDKQDAINIAAFRPDVFKELAGNEQASDLTLVERPHPPRVFAGGSAGRRCLVPRDNGGGILNSAQLR